MGGKNANMCGPFRLLTFNIQTSRQYSALKQYYACIHKYGYAPPILHALPGTIIVTILQDVFSPPSYLLTTKLSFDHQAILLPILKTLVPNPLRGRSSMCYVCLCLVIASVKMTYMHVSVLACGEYVGAKMICKHVCHFVGDCQSIRQGACHVLCVRVERTIC